MHYRPLPDVVSGRNICSARTGTGIVRTNPNPESAMRCLIPALFILSACMPRPPIAPAPLPPAPPLEITLPIGRSEAFERTLAAFRASGLPIERADTAEGVLVSVPLPGQEFDAGGPVGTATFRPHFRYHANIVQEGAGSRITVRIMRRNEFVRGDSTVRVYAGEGDRLVTIDCERDRPCLPYWVKMENLDGYITGRIPLPPGM